MDNDLDKWQNLWQQQKAGQFDIDKLTSRLVKLERISNFQRLLFLLVAAFTLYTMWSHLQPSLYNILAGSLIMLGLLFILIPLWSNQSKIKSLNNQEFIENHIQYLRKKLSIPKLYFLVFIALFILGINIAFLDAFKHTALEYRLLIHSCSILLVLIFLKLRKIGIRNYQAEILPLIKKLESIKESL